MMQNIHLSQNRFVFFYKVNKFSKQHKILLSSFLHNSFVKRKSKGFVLLFCPLGSYIISKATSKKYYDQSMATHLANASLELFD
jgi:hypothetical protein